MIRIWWIQRMQTSFIYVTKTWLRMTRQICKNICSHSTTKTSGLQNFNVLIGILNLPFMGLDNVLISDYTLLLLSWALKICCHFLLFISIFAHCPKNQIKITFIWPILSHYFKYNACNGHLRMKKRYYNLMEITYFL